jgi:CHAD domain-containing protein
MVPSKEVTVEASPVLKISPEPSPPQPATKPKLGLRAWMERVLVECDRAAAGFDVDAVHDLRVALRRCRSLADGLMALDPDSSWKDMKKAGKKVFKALGELRDMQVMEEWIEKLSVSSGDAASQVSTGDMGDPVTVKLLHYVRGRESECKQEAREDLDQFDPKQWQQWSRSLPQRASRVHPGSVVYLHLALEKWTDAYELHKHALRSRSQVGWHELRIGIKRFRYTVENFLPRQHELWGNDLKDLQDALGEVHDLDVLWALAVRPDVGAFPDFESRKRWREKLNVERAKRIARYRAKMVGKQSLWRVWRAELPAGPQLCAAAMSRLRVWAGYLDPDFAHSQRVAQLALLLYDGLRNAGLLKDGGPAGSNSNSPGDVKYDLRAVLQAAALMHDVGKVKGAANHHKKSYRMIRGLTPPLGWSAPELELAAVVARYHRGALPRLRGKTLQSIELPHRTLAMELAGVLRLANALDIRSGDGRKDGKKIRKKSESEGAPRIEVSAQDRFVEVRVGGYSALERSAEKVAAARHLLETVLRRPLLVRTLRPPAGGSRSAGPTLVTKGRAPGALRKASRN